MVYESDFYTTRRPYSRPLVSSYSVTSPGAVIPLSSVIQLRGGYPHMPYVAHKRLVTIVHTPLHNVYHSGMLVPVRIHSRVRPSVLAAELNRIRTLPRPSSISYLERYLNSRDLIYFDDEAREIRAKVDSLLRRVHVFVPRAVASDFAEEIVPERMRSHDYVRRLISGRNNEKKDADIWSWYVDVPERSNFGNLACVKYVGGKPQSVRRPYYKVTDLRPSDIRTDVNLLSFYSKNRLAAANASTNQPMTERELRKARALETEWSEAIQKREKQKEAELAPAEEVELKPAQKSKPIEKVESVPEPEPVQESQPESVKVLEPEPVATEPESEPVKEPEPVKKSKSKLLKRPKPEPKPEPVKTPEPQITEIAEPMKEPEVATTTEPESEPVKEPEPILEVEPVKEPEAELPLVEEPEPIKEPEAELPQIKEPEAELPQIKEPEVELAPVEEPESVQDDVKEPEIAPVIETVSEPPPANVTESVSEAETEEANEENPDVRQKKIDAMKRAEEFLIKEAERSRTAEEKQLAADNERLRLEMEEQKAWEAVKIAQERKENMEQILDEERALAERKAEEEQIEAELREAAKIAEEEKEMADARLRALLIEQERMVVEEHLEEVRQREEREERLAEVAVADNDDGKDADRSTEEILTADITDQEREEKPFEIVTDDDTRIEEENVPDEEVEDIADPFVEEPVGAEESQPHIELGIVETEPMIEEAATTEEVFDWGDQDS